MEIVIVLITVLCFRSYGFVYNLSSSAKCSLNMSSGIIQVNQQTLDRIVETAVKAAHWAGKIILDKSGAEVIKTKSNSKDLLTEIDGVCQKEIEKIVFSEFQGESHAFLGEENVETGSQESSKALKEALEASDFVWIVDPIDGTTNFVHSFPLSAVSIGIVFKGNIVAGCIYDPYSNETFTAKINQGSYLNGKKIKVSEENRLEEVLIAAGSPPSMLSLNPSLRGVKAISPHVRSVRMLGSAAIMLAWVACGRLTAYFEPDLNSWDVCAGAILVLEAGGAISHCNGDVYDISTRSILVSNGKTHSRITKILKDANATVPDSQ